MQEEQHSLKRELAALAISMNMEAQKKRHMVADSTQQTKRTTAREILVSLFSGSHISYMIAL